MKYLSWIVLALLASLMLGLTPLSCDSGAAKPPDQQLPDDDDDDDGDDDDAVEISGVGDATITDDGAYRYIMASGLPNHDTGDFPGPGNPHTISEQDYDFRVPLNPVQNAAPTPYTLPDLFGVALNGVVFDPFANEFYNGDRNSGWQEEPMPDGLGLDSSHAHVQPSGAYHYHGLPTGLLELVHVPGQMALVGFAADGFPVYALYGYAEALDNGSAVVTLQSSYRLKSGTRPSGPGGTYDGTYIQDYEYVADLGDLDECNGRFGVSAEFPDGTYYYVLTESYPYIPRMFQGAADSSFK